MKTLQKTALALRVPSERWWWAVKDSLQYFYNDISISPPLSACQRQLLHNSLWRSNDDQWSGWAITDHWSPLSKGRGLCDGRRPACAFPNSTCQGIRLLINAFFNQQKSSFEICFIPHLTFLYTTAAQMKFHWNTRSVWLLRLSPVLINHAERLPTCEEKAASCRRRTHSCSYGTSFSSKNRQVFPRRIDNHLFIILRIAIIILIFEAN